MVPCSLHSYAHRRAKEEHEIEHRRQESIGPSGGGEEKDAFEDADETQLEQRDKPRAKAGVVGAHIQALKPSPAARG